MGQITKRKYLQTLIDNKKPVHLVIYGRRHRLCTPVRIVGNTLNYKTAYSISECGWNAAKISSVSMASIHKVEEL